MKKTTMLNLKKRLGNAKGCSIEDLSGVLWAHRTTVKSSTRQTPFSLVYRDEAPILVKVGEPSHHYIEDIEENKEDLKENMDLLEGHLEVSLVRMIVQKQRMERYCNGKTKLPHFNAGDLVLIKVTLYTQNPNEGNLVLSRRDRTE